MGIKHKAVKKSGERGYANEWNDDHVVDGPVDFNKYEIKGLAVETGLIFPSEPVKGQLFFREDVGGLYVWNGSNWVLVSSPSGVIEGRLATSTGIIFPSNPVEGELFFKQDEGVFYVFNGIEWVNIGPFTGTISGTLIGSWKTEAYDSVRFGTTGWRVLNNMRIDLHLDEDATCLIGYSVHVWLDSGDASSDVATRLKIDGTEERATFRRFEVGIITDYDADGTNSATTIKDLAAGDHTIEVEGSCETGNELYVERILFVMAFKK